MSLEPLTDLPDAELFDWIAILTGRCQGLLRELQRRYPHEQVAGLAIGDYQKALATVQHYERVLTPGAWGRYMRERMAKR